MSRLRVTSASATKVTPVQRPPWSRGRAAKTGRFARGAAARAGGLTRAHNPPAPHVHADRALILRSCSATPCETLQIAKGDSEVAITADDELEVRAGQTKIRVHFRMLDGEERYPHQPQW